MTSRQAELKNILRDRLVSCRGPRGPSTAHRHPDLGNKPQDIGAHIRSGRTAPVKKRKHRADGAIGLDAKSNFIVSPMCGVSTTGCDGVFSTIGTICPARLGRPSASGQTAPKRENFDGEGPVCDRQEPSDFGPSHGKTIRLGRDRRPSSPSDLATRTTGPAPRVSTAMRTMPLP